MGTRDTTDGIEVAHPTRTGLSDAINRIAAALRRNGAAGARASLRRLHWDDPTSPAYWRFLTEYVQEAGLLPADGEGRHDVEVSWAAILAATAQLADLHRPGRALGLALAAARFSELRLVRLLRARDRALLENVRLAARYLAAKGEYVDCADLAWLVLGHGGPSGEKMCRDIARDYYASENP